MLWVLAHGLLECSVGFLELCLAFTKKKNTFWVNCRLNALWGITRWSFQQNSWIFHHLLNWNSHIRRRRVCLCLSQSEMSDSSCLYNKSKLDLSSRLINLVYVSVMKCCLCYWTCSQLIHMRRCITLSRFLIFWLFDSFWMSCTVSSGLTLWAQRLTESPERFSVWPYENCVYSVL